MSTINATNIKNAASSVTNIILDTNGGITSADSISALNFQGKRNGATDVVFVSSNEAGDTNSRGILISRDGRTRIGGNLANTNTAEGNISLNPDGTITTVGSANIGDNSTIRGTDDTEILTISGPNNGPGKYQYRFNETSFAMGAGLSTGADAALVLDVDGRIYAADGTVNFSYVDSLGGYATGSVGGYPSATATDGGFFVVGAGTSSATPVKKGLGFYAPNSDGSQSQVPYINILAGNSWSAQGETFGSSTSIFQLAYAAPGAEKQQVIFQQRFDGAMRWGTGTQLSGSEGGNVKIFPDGTCEKLSGGPWAGVSDQRTKEAIVDYSSGLTEVKQLQPRSFRYIGNDKTYVGLVAQETENIMPEMVTKRSGTLPNGTKVDDFRTLDATALTFALVNAVKELSATVEALEAEVQALKGGAS